VQQGNFNDYQLLIMNKMPVVEVHIVENDESQGGVGESGMPPIAPAVCHAIFALTGKRVAKSVRRALIRWRFPAAARRSWNRCQYSRRLACSRPSARSFARSGTASARLKRTVRGSAAM